MEVFRGFNLALYFFVKYFRLMNNMIIFNSFIKTTFYNPPYAAVFKRNIDDTSFCDLLSM